MYHTAVVDDDAKGGGERKVLMSSCYNSEVKPSRTAVSLFNAVDGETRRSNVCLGLSFAEAKTAAAKLIGITPTEN